MTKYKVYDWIGNDVKSPVFNNFDDAVDWISETIDRVYGELSDDEFDVQFGEYVIHDITSDEDNE